MQEWYLNLVAARELHVEPWILEEQSLEWRNRVLAMLEIDARVSRFQPVTTGGAGRYGEE